MKLLLAARQSIILAAVLVSVVLSLVALPLIVALACIMSGVRRLRRSPLHLEVPHIYAPGPGDEDDDETDEDDMHHPRPA
jgi:hypothetical protein